MRKPIIVGNWKMFTNQASAADLVKGIVNQVGNIENIEIGVCPPFVYLQSVKNIIEGTNIKLGAQDSHWEKEGAFTGEVSPYMIKDIGCTYVIIGHSERRHQMGETDDIINKKIKAGLNVGLYPIFCIGELLEERQENKTETVLRRQIEQGLDGLTAVDMDKIIVAYEPVWAIGTGKTATPEQAQETHSFIRKFISTIYDRTIADDVRIMYGGSVKPDNIAELSVQADLDGALVGGASLKADLFSQIITRFNK
jgi:triosephosphate isomerase